MKNSIQPPVIELRSISKSFDDQPFINNFNLTINHGEFLTILGPSGCGKTTILRLMAGFEKLDSGNIILDGQDVTNIPAENRNINTVFQSYALFPHMSVFENVAFGLKMQKVPKEEIKSRVIDALKMVRLEEMAHRKPDQLSGGQQQRVAIARAVVNKPKVLLLDESLSALDYKLRQEMQNELKALQRQLGITFVFVTHDQEEALAMSDRIIVLDKGVIQQDGTPRDIYEEPKNLFVAHFIGQINIFDGIVTERLSENKLKATIEGKSIEVTTNQPYHVLPIEIDDQIKVLLRPEDIVIKEINPNEQSQAIIGHIIDRCYKGKTLDSTVKLEHSGQEVLVSEFFNEDDPNIDHDLGQRVALSWYESWEVVIKDETT